VIMQAFTAGPFPAAGINDPVQPADGGTVEVTGDWTGVRKLEVIFLYGFIDVICPRGELRDCLAKILDVLAPPAKAAAQESTPAFWQTNEKHPEDTTRSVS